MGSCGLVGFDDRVRKAEPATMIGDKTHWRQGVGKPAMIALVDHGFERLNPNRILLRMSAFNERALGPSERLGFVEEGRLEDDCFHEGAYWDTILMGLLRSEWADRRWGGE